MTKITNLDPPGIKAFDRVKGRSGSAGARTPGVKMVDASGNEATAAEWQVLGATITDNDDETAVLTIGTGTGSTLPNVNAPITAALSNPPTQGEIEAAIGESATGVPGQVYQLIDSDTGLTYLVASVGGAFVFLPTAETAGDLVTLANAAGIFSDFAAMSGAAVYDATSDTTFWTYLNAAGDAVVRSWDHATQTASAATVLHSALDPGDSHAQPAILIRSSDRKVLVFYAAHAGANLYVRISSAAADISAFGSETDLDASIGGTTYTYPIAFELSDGMYLFMRSFAGSDFMWSYTKSTDNGATWAAKVDLANESGGQLYWMPAKTAANRIDFLATDAAPFGVGSDVSLFHFYMLAGGAIYQTDGDEITATKPIATASMTMVWESDGTQRANPGQVVLDGDGNPCALFRDFETVSPEDCRYMWTRWDGSAWTTAVEIAAAGSGSLTATAVFADGDPFTVYYSKDVGGVAQIHRATSANEGLTWTHRALTDSAIENALLVTVRSGAPELPVIWNALSGGWTRDDTVAAAFLGGSFVPVEGADTQRIVVLDGDAAGDGLAEAIWRRGTDGIWYISRDLGATWEPLASGSNPAAGLLTIDAGTPSYNVAGADLVVTYASDWGYDADGPYYDDTGAATGEEAILAIDPSSGQITVVPYNP